MTHKQQTRLDAFELVKEQDVFKLAVLGHAAIEERVDAAIAEAFGEIRT